MNVINRLASEVGIVYYTDIDYINPDKYFYISCEDFFNEYDNTIKEVGGVEFEDLDFSIQEVITTYNFMINRLSNLDIDIVKFEDKFYFCEEC